MKIDNNWLALTSKRFHPTKLAEQVQEIEARTNVRVTATTQETIQHLKRFNTELQTLRLHVALKRFRKAFRGATNVKNARKTQ